MLRPPPQFKNKTISKNPSRIAIFGSNCWLKKWKHPFYGFRHVNVPFSSNSPFFHPMHWLFHSTHWLDLPNSNPMTETSILVRLNFPTPPTSVCIKESSLFVDYRGALIFLSARTWPRFDRGVRPKWNEAANLYLLYFFFRRARDK